VERQHWHKHDTRERLRRNFPKILGSGWEVGSFDGVVDIPITPKLGHVEVPFKKNSIFLRGEEGVNKKKTHCLLKPRRTSSDVMHKRGDGKKLPTGEEVPVTHVECIQESLH